jgi:hypothetical protein
MQAGLQAQQCDCYASITCIHYSYDYCLHVELPQFLLFMQAGTAHQLPFACQHVAGNVTHHHHHETIADRQIIDSSYHSLLLDLSIKMESCMHAIHIYTSDR